VRAAVINQRERERVWASKNSYFHLSTGCCSRLLQYGGQHRLNQHLTQECIAVISINQNCIKFQLKSN